MIVKTSHIYAAFIDLFKVLQTFTQQLNERVADKSI